MWTRAALLLAAVVAVVAAEGRGGASSGWDGTVRGKCSAGRAPMPTGSRVTLNQGEHTAFVALDGQFRFHGVAPGTYTLEVVAPDIVYPEYKLDVAESGKMRAIAYEYPGAPRTMVQMPLVLAPVGAAAYFMARPKLNPLTLLKNPMVLMMGVMFLMMGVVMPKMMDAMTPEERAKMQSQMGSGGNPMEMFKNILNPEEEPATEPRRVTAAGGGAVSGKRKGKRS